ncbi:hypothetical protein C8R43DRAFT_962994 [Mycena crocata]|nr:hypothetical protein C8R43DRAFT_962994 [Mycena crocata]
MRKLRQSTPQRVQPPGIATLSKLTPGSLFLPLTPFRAHRPFPSSPPCQAAGRRDPSPSTPRNSGKGKSAKSVDASSQVERDKYSVLVAPRMPPGIPSWANALPQHTQLLTGQQWRDVLRGLVTERGHEKSKTRRRSAAIQDLIRPALQAANVTDLEGFPAPVDDVPDFTLERTHEIVWQVAETSFRFECVSLDRRASGLARLDKVKFCFAGRTLLFPPLSLGKKGLAAESVQERHRYIGRIATLMLNWTTKSQRPRIINRIAYPSERWSVELMEELEAAVAVYYTQAFYEYFGRAAIVPMRLAHNVVDA